MKKAFVGCFMTAGLLACPAAASAQTAPWNALSLSPDLVGALNQDARDSFLVLDSFSRGKRGIDRFGNDYDKPGGWKLYGRFYILNFQNALDKPEDLGLHFTWRRTGPAMPGHSRAYVGLYRRF